MFVMILSYNRYPEWFRESMARCGIAGGTKLCQMSTKLCQMGPGCGDHSCYNDKKIKLGW